jgi:putative drug exporter of the RND superfamily
VQLKFYTDVEGGAVTRLADWLVRHKLIVGLGWLAVLVVGVVLAPAVTDRMSTTFSLPGHDGYQANVAIAGSYDSGGRSHPSVPVITLPAGTDVDASSVRDGIRRGFDEIARTLPARVVSYGSTGDRRFVSADGRTTYGLVFPMETASTSVDTDPNAVMVATLRTALPDGAGVQITGISQLTRHESGSDGAEVVTLTLIGSLGALLVLIFVFGSFLAVVPLVVAAVAIMATLLLVGLQTLVTDVNLIVIYLVGLIGLGVAIDYSLLLVTRWREELTSGRDPDDAIRRAMATAGRAVVLSGTTVAVGLLSLVVLPVPFLRSVGYSGLLIPLVSVLVNITLLPVLLAAAGRRLDWPWRTRHHHQATRAWSAWARGVIRARWPAVAISVAGLALLGVFAFDLNVGPAQATALAKDGPAREALNTLRGAGIPSGTLTPLEVLVPGGTDPGSVASRLAQVPGVWTATAPDDPAWRRDGTALVAVAPAAEPGSADGKGTVERIRAVTAKEFPGARVGGAPAEDTDFATAVYDRFPLMVAVISVLSFILLTRAFRSVVLAAKAVVVNLLSIGAVLGAIVLVWQLGHGAAALGGVGATAALDTYVPMFVFAFLFGLSMDYEVFLLARMREGYDRLGETDPAVVEGVGRTGRLVTSAALIMFLAFASLAGAQDTVTKIFATGLGAGILLDATVVRSLLVPALVSIMGRWSWWLPPWAARVLRVAR